MGTIYMLSAFIKSFLYITSAAYTILGMLQGIIIHQFWCSHPLLALPATLPMPVLMIKERVVVLAWAGYPDR